jgi:hypothetical protein
VTTVRQCEQRDLAALEHHIDRYPFLDDDGVRHVAADPCRYLVKAALQVIFRRRTSDNT